MDPFAGRADGAQGVTSEQARPGRSDAFDAGREIHVLMARPRDWVTEDSRARWLGMLNEEEAARHARFKFDRSKEEFLCGRALMRSSLGAYLGKDPASVEIAFSDDGKPRIDQGDAAGGIAPLAFNLSHTEGLVALAIGVLPAIGIDVEFHSPDRATASIANRFFSARESAWLQTLPPEEYAGAFFRIWTLKEAYLKARGTGLRLSLGGFFVLPESPELAAWGIGFAPGFGDDPARWRLHSAAPDAVHSVGLLAETPPGADAARVVTREIPPDFFG